MPLSAIVCFIIAALATVVGIQNVVTEISHSNDMAYLAGCVVGSFLIPFIFLIGGLKILEKSKKS